MSTDNKLMQATSLLNEGKMEEARPILDEYIKANPNETEGGALLHK